MTGDNEENCWSCDRDYCVPKMGSGEQGSEEEWPMPSQASTISSISVIVCLSIMLIAKL